MPTAGSTQGSEELRHRSSSAAAVVGAGSSAEPGDAPDGIACFSAGGSSRKVDGLFDTLDVNVNQDGCAVGTPAGETERNLMCWGVFAGSIPGSHSPDIADLSVSLTQACVLDLDGKVSCFDAAP